MPSIHGSATWLLIYFVLLQDILPIAGVVTTHYTVFRSDHT